MGEAYFYTIRVVGIRCLCTLYGAPCQMNWGHMGIQDSVLVHYGCAPCYAYEVGVISVVQ